MNEMGRPPGQTNGNNDRSFSLPEVVGDEQGGTLIIVLVVTAVLSAWLAVVLSYSRWDARLSPVYEYRKDLHTARRTARSLVSHHIATNLSDTTIRSPVTRTWELPPDVTIEAEIGSLNDRLNINLLAEPDPGGAIRDLFQQIFSGLGYPRRTVDEVIDWTQPEGRLDQQTDRYAGYPYSAPGRPLRSLDELKLISGIRQRGLRSGVRDVLTVHGTGNWNLRQLEETRWTIIRRTLVSQSERMDASMSFSDFQSLLDNGDRLSEIQQEYPFVTTRDDSFEVTVRVARGPVQRTYEMVFTVDGEPQLQIIH